MDFLDRYDRLIRIAQYIRQKGTGTPQELAKKCEIDSEKTLLRQIDILRLFAIRKGADILYNRNRKTYYFEPPGKFTYFEFIKDTNNQDVT